VTDRLLTAEEVADRLQLPVDDVHQLAKRDRIPHLRLGHNALRFRAKAIDRWLEEEERGDFRA
jgi:excisionase family DNA binding protein